MSDPVGNYENALAMDLTIKVTVKTPEEKEDLVLPGNGSVRQFGGSPSLLTPSPGETPSDLETIHPLPNPWALPTVASSLAAVTTPTIDPAQISHAPQSSSTANLGAAMGDEVFSSAMQAMLQRLTEQPGMLESMMSGPCASTMLDCLSHNPDFAAQMMLSNPLFAGNPQLQEEIRLHLPEFLQQSPEVLAAMLNPRAVRALTQIQQGLQVLAAEAPRLIPGVVLGEADTGYSPAPGSPPDSAPDDPGNGPQVAVETEQQHQQQEFVQQMLQALARTSQQGPGEEQRS
ncbi:ubiquilin-1-like isoform X2 [Osmerus eperlanus]|uniref:ubiquilin-1-like isoform X2 n=1 Tax=Osmerus eperlanus TaxID=29151 RepID=UPI002E13DE04